MSDVYESTNPQDREPTIGRQGNAYVSILDGNLFININEKTIFDLSEKDGHDLVMALSDALQREAARKARKTVGIPE